jgi:hypothetical protein
MAGSVVIGGILGTVIGSKVADFLKSRVKNSYFLISALFTIPGSISLFLAINISGPDNILLLSSSPYFHKYFIGQTQLQ